jgi:hypothetical protein
MIIRLALAILSTACFVSLVLYLLASQFQWARRASDWLMQRTASHLLPPSIFLWLVVGGLFICLFQGADALLFWLPNPDWRLSISVAFALLGVIVLASIFDNASIRRTNLPDTDLLRNPPSWWGAATRSAPWYKGTKQPGDP